MALSGALAGRLKTIGYWSLIETSKPVIERTSKTKEDKNPRAVKKGENGSEEFRMPVRRRVLL